jgi:hypothetical protein
MQQAISLQAFAIDPMRARAAESISDVRNYTLANHGGEPIVSASVESASCTLAAEPDATRCNCADWQRGKLQSPPRLCKHLIRLALENKNNPDPHNLPKMAGTGTIPQSDIALPESEPEPDANHPPGFVPPFRRRRQILPGSLQETIHARIGQAIDKWARELEAEIRDSYPDDVWLLYGPSGTGKTSAINQLALNMQCGIEFLAGSDSWADSDLVGFANPTNSERIPGVIGRAFARARNGENVILFLDEFLRFNRRAHDILMRAIHPTSAAIGRAMGIDTTEDLYIAESPLWGIEYAPVNRIAWVAATNPWGIIPDSAMIRRMIPLPGEFSASVLAPLSAQMRDVILATWAGVADGSLPLAIEYQAISRMTEPDDSSILIPYIRRLALIDQPAADAMRDICSACGIAAAT